MKSSFSRSWVKKDYVGKYKESINKYQPADTIEAENDTVTLLLVAARAGNLEPAAGVDFIFKNHKYRLIRTHDARTFIVRPYESSHGIGRKCKNFTLGDLHDMMNELMISEVHRL